MGRTVPSAAILLMQEQAHYSQFKKALARSDQLALEQLFIYANLHVAEAANTDFELPIVMRERRGQNRPRPTRFPSSPGKFGKVRSMTKAPTAKVVPTIRSLRWLYNFYLIDHGNDARLFFGNLFHSIHGCMRFNRAGEGDDPLVESNIDHNIFRPRVIFQSLKQFFSKADTL